MTNVDRTLNRVVGRLSDQNYSQSFAFYRLWFNLGRKHLQIPSNGIFDTIWNSRAKSLAAFGDGGLTHPSAHLILRFARDAGSDQILAPHSSGLQSRLSARLLRDFFNNNLELVENGKTRGNEGGFYADVNLIARWANLGYVEEATIRHEILQSLISHPTLWDHQAGSLIILFKLAGATFEAYADPSVIDRCFELLKDHYNRDSTGMGLTPRHFVQSSGSVKMGLVRVRAHT